MSEPFPKPPTDLALRRRARAARAPDGMREAILVAAGAVLTEGGKEGLTLTRVAQRAGVNRGTAYHYFPTRERLIEATTAWVSEKLYRAVFGDPDAVISQPVGAARIEEFAANLAKFAMESPKFGRAWLFELLSSQRPTEDPLCRQSKAKFEQFANTDFAQPGIDPEVLSVVMLAGVFIWPIWMRAHARTAKERQELTQRFTQELLRLSLYGSMRPEKYPELASTLPGADDAATSA